MGGVIFSDEPISQELFDGIQENTSDFFIYMGIRYLDVQRDEHMTFKWFKYDLARRWPTVHHKHNKAT